MNKIRIIAGALRSRQITVLDETKLRPTPNRIRETLFNWLREEINGARCLDLFAGSGALGFEALSRGALAVTFIEKDHAIMRNLKQNSTNLKIDAAEFIRADARTWLEEATPSPFDIIFLDPPYAENLIAPCLERLVSGGFLAPGAFIYIEHDHDLEDISYPQGLSLLRHKKAGKVFYGLLVTSATTSKS